MNESLPNIFHVPEEGRTLANFRDDLRLPTMQFGRCSITGDWGNVITVDLGDLAFDAPNVDEGVEYDPETKKVVFTKWRPSVFHSQVMLSTRGIELLLAWSKDQESAIPMLKPVLVYGWEVLYNDGGIYTQFMYKGEEMVENSSREIDYAKATQVTIRPLDPDSGLPTITFNMASGKFFENGEEIDVDYDEDYPDGMPVVCARKVVHTFGSTMDANSLNRNISNACTSVLYLLGWHQNGVVGIETPNTARCNVIAVDERGNWRPWKQG